MQYQQNEINRSYKKMMKEKVASLTEAYHNLDYMLNFVNKFEPYYVMPLIFIGLIGNTISFLIFTLTKLK